MPPFPRIIVNDKVYAGKKKIAKKQNSYDGYSGKNNKAPVGGKIEIGIRSV
jgi:hypothetical protein